MRVVELGATTYLPSGLPLESSTLYREIAQRASAVSGGRPALRKSWLRKSRLSGTLSHTCGRKVALRPSASRIRAVFAGTDLPEDLPCRRGRLAWAPRAAKPRPRIAPIPWRSTPGSAGRERRRPPRCRPRPAPEAARPGGCRAARRRPSAGSRKSCHARARALNARGRVPSSPSSIAPRARYRPAPLRRPRPIPRTARRRISDHAILVARRTSEWPRRAAAPDMVLFRERQQPVQRRRAAGFGVIDAVAQAAMRARVAASTPRADLVAGSADPSR